MSGGRAPASGSELYSIVEHYASFGDHHTGTPADHATNDWLADLLVHRGWEVERPAYRFDRFVAEAMLVAGDDPVPALPLFYSAVGAWDTDRVTVVELEKGAAGRVDVVDDAVRSASGDGAVAVSISGPTDLVVQVNRRPEVTLERPAVVIPRNRAVQVRAGANLIMRASLEPDAVATNIVARRGPVEGPPVVVTTPLTGWTPCAGERGTGLAVALAVADDLATDHRVELVGCGGHELDFTGLRRFLAGRDVTGYNVVHLGASVAAVEAVGAGEPPVLARSRNVLTTAADRAGIARQAAAAHWRLSDLGPDDDWPGEGGTWKAAGARVLSFVGGFELFHTAGDVPEAATTPDALTVAAEAAVETSRHFLDVAGRGDDGVPS